MLRPAAHWILMTAVLAPAVVAAPPDANTAQPVNRMCPVMPDQPASEEWWCDHDGRRVYFCCERCVQLFRAEPAKYTTNSPDQPPVSSDESLRWLVPMVAGFDRLVEYPVLIGGGIGMLVLTLIAIRTVRRARRSGVKSRVVYICSAFLRPTTLVVLALATVCGQFGLTLWNTRHHVAPGSQVATAGSVDHTPGHVTAGKYLVGYSWPHGLHALPRGLSNTYYRGNDERSEKLFNGGNYLTATFRVSVVTADGRAVSPGDIVTGQELRVRCDITRAPNTSAGFFTPDRFAVVVLASGQTADGLVPLKTVRDGSDWSAEGVIGTPAGGGHQSLRGVWYLGLLPKPTSGPTLFMPHYAIPFVIHTDGGRVRAESVVWMTAVYASPNLDAADADGQWFSDRPIPEIPDGRGSTDPKLLGLDRPDGEHKPSTGKK